MFKYKVFAGNRGTLTSMAICQEVGYVRAWTIQQAYRKAKQKYPGAYGYMVQR